jgi:hypothetical protein
VGPRTGLDDVKKKNLSPTGPSNSDPSAVQPVTCHHTGSFSKKSRSHKSVSVLLILLLFGDKTVFHAIFLSF